MKRVLASFVAIIVVLAAVAVSGCSSATSDEDGDEESGTQYTLGDTVDETRNGVRLIISYDEQSNSFPGTVENTTDDLIEQVRVEVHLSNGTELGPTTPVDLAPGETTDVTLPATSTSFDTWFVHAEVGSSEEGGEHAE